MRKKPWGGKRLDPSLRRAVERRVPFPLRILEHRDELGSQLDLVAEVGDRRLYVFSVGAVLWATIRGEEVVKVMVVEGRAGAELYDKYTFQLPPGEKERILASLLPGRDAGESLREAFGERLVPLQDLGETARKGHRTVWFIVNVGWPRRRAVLHIDLDPAGAIVEAGILEEKRAVRAIDDLV